MVRAYSIDLRECVVRFVLVGNSCYETSRRFATSPSFVINIMELWRQTGSVKPRKRGSKRLGKLAPHREFILARVAERPDVTMLELAAELKARSVTVDPASLSHFLIRNGLSYKKPVWQAKPGVPDLQAVCEEWKGKW